MDWKGIVEKVTVAVIAGILLGCLGWAATSVMAPPVSPVSVTADRIQVANPAFLITTAQARDLDPALERAFGFRGLVTYLQNFRISRAQIIVLRLRNTEKYRSKEVTVIAQRAALFSSASTGGNPNVQSEIAIPFLEPGASAEVYAIAQGRLFTNEELPIKVLHDGHLLDIALKEFEPEFDPLVRAAAAHPIVTIILMIIGALTCVLFPLAMLAQLLFGDFLKRITAKYISPRDLKRQAEFVEYVRQHYPEKMH